MTWRWVGGPHPASQAGPRSIRRHEDYVPAEGAIICWRCDKSEAAWGARFTRITEYRAHLEHAHGIKP